MKIIDLMETDTFYHISDNPNLVPNEDYEPKQGQMGKAFYVTSEPKMWQDSLGGRKYMYEIDTSNLNITNDSPTRSELNDWALENGYFEMAIQRRKNGEVILDLDGAPMVRPTVTAKATKFLWQDPMTGSTLNGLQNEFMRQQGFDGYEAEYSPEGHQIAIWNFDKIKLKRVGDKLS